MKTIRGDLNNITALSELFLNYSRIYEDTHKKMNLRNNYAPFRTRRAPSPVG